MRKGASFRCALLALALIGAGAIVLENRPFPNACALLG
jgi:hypothetical protein